MLDASDLVRGGFGAPGGGFDLANTHASVLGVGGGVERPSQHAPTLRTRRLAPARISSAHRGRAKKRGKKTKTSQSSCLSPFYSSNEADAAAAFDHNNNRARCEERGRVFSLFTHRESPGGTLEWPKGASLSGHKQSVSWFPLLLLPIGRFLLRLTRICLLVNTGASARTPSGALMHPFQWCNGERSFSCFCRAFVLIKPRTEGDFSLAFSPGFFIFSLFLCFPTETGSIRAFGRVAST